MRAGRRAGDACAVQVRSSRVSFSDPKESGAGTQVRIHSVREFSNLHIDGMFLVHLPSVLHPLSSTWLAQASSDVDPETRPQQDFLVWPF